MRKILPKSKLKKSSVLRFGRDELDPDSLRKSEKYGPDFQVEVLTLIIQLSIVASSYCSEPEYRY
jgi:hypothetical protein